MKNLKNREEEDHGGRGESLESVLNKNLINITLDDHILYMAAGLGGREEFENIKNNIFIHFVSTVLYKIRAAYLFFQFPLYLCVYHIYMIHVKYIFYKF